jgi:prophage antirepressor-like protein
VIDINGEPWFVAKDVVDVLSLNNVTMALQNINPIEVQNYRIPGTRGRPNKLVSESGLYKMVMRTGRPEAE